MSTEFLFFFRFLKKSTEMSWKTQIFQLLEAYLATVHFWNQQTNSCGIELLNSKYVEFPEILSDSYMMQLWGDLVNIEELGSAFITIDRASRERGSVPCPCGPNVKIGF